jgi:carboxyl-terminal processing protease
MNPKFRTLFLIFVSSLLFACRAFTPTVPSTPYDNSVAKNLPLKPTFTIQPSLTPKPSLTFTALPPTLTPTLTITSTPSSTPISLAVQLSIFEDLWTIVNDTYVYPDFNGLDWDAIHQEVRQKIEAGLTSQEFYIEMENLINDLGDEHSFLLEPQLVAQQQEDYEGTHDYVGIGVMVSAVPERNRAVILSVFHGGSAEEAGLQPRDSILSVDSTPILDENGFLRDIVRGPEGTSIDLVVEKPNEEPRHLTLTRQRITGDYPLVYQVITTPQGDRIGYILLVTFEDGTVDEKVANALEEMTSSGPLDGLILDNRMNNGGSSLVLNPLLSYFAGGTLGYYVNHEKERPLEIKLHDVSGSSKIPMVVLIGSGTASFGEIFAGILQDIDRAYLIGTTTMGNVEILWGYDLEDGSQLWLANETFRPRNHPQQNWEQSGIIPNLTVQGDFDQYTLESDPPVLAAAGYLSGQ